VALGLLAGIALFELHAALQEASLAVRLNPWVARAVRQLALPVLGLIWLVFIFALEPLLRNAWRTGQLWPQAGRILAAVVAVWAFSFAARVLL
jgi:hypothetical protein